MIMPEISPLNLNEGALRYAIIGGLVSIPLSLGHHWWSGMGNTFSTLPIFFGGLLAGYLAQKNTQKPATAGVGAGLIGGLPGYIFMLPSMVQTVTASSPGTVLVLAFFIPVILAVAALPGWIGGLVGGWLAKKVERKQVTAANS
ncbi:DUF5518 domain-containing protein [Halalkalicoccus tibetensis]|uniref:DUF5518 domain-containing protein n=1 Tax=Halalkalicoccus tibetensis TaxID=175632 RepID=A0ABD5UXK5_9EURY